MTIGDVPADVTKEKHIEPFPRNVYQGKGLANVQGTLAWTAKERSPGVYCLGAGQYLPSPIKADGTGSSMSAVKKGGKRAEKPRTTGPFARNYGAIIPNGLTVFI